MRSRSGPGSRSGNADGTLKVCDRSNPTSRSTQVTNVALFVNVVQDDGQRATSSNVCIVYTGLNIYDEKHASAGVDDVIFINMIVCIRTL